MVWWKDLRIAWKNKDGNPSRNRNYSRKPVSRRHCHQGVEMPLHWVQALRCYDRAREKYLAPTTSRSCYQKSENYEGGLYLIFYGRFYHEAIERIMADILFSWKIGGLYLDLFMDCRKHAKYLGHKCKLKIDDLRSEIDILHRTTSVAPLTLFLTRAIWCSAKWRSTSSCFL